MPLQRIAPPGRSPTSGTAAAPLSSIARARRLTWRDRTARCRPRRRAAEARATTRHRVRPPTGLWTPHRTPSVGPPPTTSGSRGRPGPETPYVTEHRLGRFGSRRRSAGRVPSRQFGVACGIWTDAERARGRCDVGALELASATCVGGEKTAGPARTARYGFVSSTPNCTAPEGSSSPGMTVTTRAFIPSNYYDSGTRARGETPHEPKVDTSGGPPAGHEGEAAVHKPPRTRYMIRRHRWAQRPSWLPSLPRPAVGVGGP